MNARTTLALIVGVDRVDAPLVDDFAAPRSLVPVAEFERDALRLRPDVAASARLLTVAQESVTANVGQYYPSVSLNVTGFLYREYYGDASKWSAILSANLPIFSAGLIQADVRAAWSRLRQAALDESYTRRQALAQVRQSYQKLHHGRPTPRRAQRSGRRRQRGAVPGTQRVRREPGGQPRRADGAGSGAHVGTSADDGRVRPDDLLPRPAARHGHAHRQRHRDRYISPDDGPCDRAGKRCGDATCGRPTAGAERGIGRRGIVRRGFERTRHR